MAGSVRTSGFREFQGFGPPHHVLISIFSYIPWYSSTLSTFLRHDYLHFMCFDCTKDLLLPSSSQWCCSKWYIADFQFLHSGETSWAASGDSPRRAKALKVLQLQNAVDWLGCTLNTSEVHIPRKGVSSSELRQPHWSIRGTFRGGSWYTNTWIVTTLIFQP